MKQEAKPPSCGTAFKLCQRTQDALAAVADGATQTDAGKQTAPGQVIDVLGAAGAQGGRLLSGQDERESTPLGVGRVLGGLG